MYGSMMTVSPALWHTCVMQPGMSREPSERLRVVCGGRHSSFRSPISACAGKRGGCAFSRHRNPGGYSKGGRHYMKPLEMCCPLRMCSMHVIQMHVTQGKGLALCSRLPKSHMVVHERLPRAIEVYFSPLIDSLVVCCCRLG